MAAKRGRYENTGSWKKPFLAALRKYPNVRTAARMAGAWAAAVYKERGIDREFAKEMDDALAEGVGYVEKKSFDLARNTDPKNNNMRMFLLRAHMPEVYGDKSELLLKGSREDPLYMSHGIDLKNMSMEDLDTLDRILSKFAPGDAAEPGGGTGGEGSTVAP